jgi:hypothetical protein
MQRIKLKILLPLGQLILAVVLLTIGQHLDIRDKYEPRPLAMATRVCFAINAPALVASWLITWGSVATHFRKPPSAILSPIDEIPFLVLLTVQWYFVARRLESFFSEGKTLAIPPRSPSQIIGNLLFLSIGAILLWDVIAEFRYFNLYIHSAADAVLCFLTLLWGVGLLFFSGRVLLQAFLRPAGGAENR